GGTWWGKHRVPPSGSVAPCRPRAGGATRGRRGGKRSVAGRKAMDNRASAEQTARDALAEAAAVDRRMRARTRGYGVFVLALALFFPAVLLVLGFVPLDPVVLAVGSAVVGLSVGVGSAVVGARLTTTPAASTDATSRRF